MPTSDPIQILIRSDAWGTRELLKICANLTDEQYHRKFEVGLSSLHDTLCHMVSTMRRWTDRLAQRTPRPILLAIPEYPHLGGDTRPRPPAELLSLLDAAESDLADVADAIAREHRLATIVEVSWPGSDGVTKTHRFTRGAVITHVTTHGYHHRAQCLNMLRQLGAPVPGVTDGYPELIAVDWQAAVEGMPG
jgi:uncharacterized damage-inducible protein DinB